MEVAMCNACGGTLVRFGYHEKSQDYTIENPCRCALEKVRKDKPKMLNKKLY